MTLGGTLRAPHILPRLGPCSEEASAGIRFQFDLRADEQDEQAKKTDTEESEESDDRKGNKGGQQPADGGHDKNNDLPDISRCPSGISYRCVYELPRGTGPLLLVQASGGRPVRL